MTHDLQAIDVSAYASASVGARFSASPAPAGTRHVYPESRRAAPHLDNEPNAIAKLVFRSSPATSRESRITHP
jgi:hypothetical protein